MPIWIEPAVREGSVWLEMEGCIQPHLRLEVGNPGDQDGYYSILYPILCYCRLSEEAWMMVSEEVGCILLLSPRNDVYWMYDVTGIDTVDHIDHWSQMVPVQGALNS